MAAEATEANKTLSASESEVKRLTQATKNFHKELAGAPEDWDTTGTLSVPSTATFRRFGEVIDGIHRDIKSEESLIRERKKRIESIQCELGRIERRGELPSEQALHNARTHRERGWSFVLAEWKGEGIKGEFVPGTPLEDAFPQAIVQADAVADQLHHQAAAVAQAEEHRLQITQSEKQNHEATDTIRKLQNKLTEVQTAWAAEWLPCGITPRTPTEMEEWREGWSQFKDRLRQLREAEETFQRKSIHVQKARMQLARVLSESGEKDFALLYAKAIRQVQQGEQASGRRIEIIRQIQGLSIQLEPLARNHDRLSMVVKDATNKWGAQCRMAGLPENISPTSGLVLLEERKALLSKFDNWKESSAQSQRTREAVRQYEQAIAEKAVLLSARGDTPESREIDLWKMLAKARVTQTRHEQLAGQIEEAKHALEECQESHNQAVQALEEFIHMAKLETSEALEPLLANVEVREQARSRIATLRDTLSGLARGQAVDEFLARIRAEDADALSQRKSALQVQKQEKEAALHTVIETVYALKSQKQTLEAAGDTAANYRQQAESCAARLKQDASRFVRLRLAAHFLQTQIERFRKENQGPLLEKSGHVFQGITRGAFVGLGAEFNADDTPVLVGLRPDKSSVPIAGMSDGSRDQLYLSLRLAALDQYLEQHEPMPLILDDLLITFDDERVIAILPQLSALAQRTQIFLFTHHDHLVELCRRTLDKDAFHFHRLNICVCEKAK